MLNIGFTELLVIFFVAYIIVGPKDLPKVIRTIVKAIKKIRTLFEDLKEESGWNDIINEVETTQKQLQEPLKEITDQVNEIEHSLEDDTHETGNN